VRTLRRHRGQAFAVLVDVDCGKGGTKGPDLRVDQVRGAAPVALFWILSNGVVRRGMPVWSKLPEPERWQIVSFLNSLPPEAKTEPDNTPARQGPAR